MYVPLNVTLKKMRVILGMNKSSPSKIYSSDRRGKHMGNM